MVAVEWAAVERETVRHVPRSDDETPQLTISRVRREDISKDRQPAWALRLRAGGGGLPTQSLRVSARCWVGRHSARV